MRVIARTACIPDRECCGKTYPVQSSERVAIGTLVLFLVRLLGHIMVDIERPPDDSKASNEESEKQPEC